MSACIRIDTETISTQIFSSLWAWLYASEVHQVFKLTWKVGWRISIRNCIRSIIRSVFKTPPLHWSAHAESCGSHHHQHKPLRHFRHWSWVNRLQTARKDHTSNLAHRLTICLDLLRATTLTSWVSTTFHHKWVPPPNCTKIFIPTILIQLSYQKSAAGQA